MNKKVTKVLGGVLVIAVLSEGYYGYEQYSQVQSENSRLEQKLDQSQNQVKKGTQEKAKTEKDLNAAEDSLKKAEKDKSNNKKELKKLKKEIEQLKKDLVAKKAAKENKQVAIVETNPESTQSEQRAIAVEASVPVAQEQPKVQQQKSTKQVDNNANSGNSSSVKSWIANKESGGSYGATNGRYIGKYQLDSSYLNGDYSAANQEKVADKYVSGRYGSWEAAKNFWQANGWY